MALITGGAKRIGKEISKNLAYDGWKVIIHYNTNSIAAKNLKNQIIKRKGKAAIIKCDLNNNNSVKDLIEKSKKKFGNISLLINNASTYYPTPLDKLNITSWDDLLGSNLKAPLFLSKYAAPYLKKTKGSIVNITDNHIKNPKNKYIIYSIAKAGLVTLTHSLAKELSPNVRVNAVAPGPIMWPEDINEFSKKYREKVIKETLLKKIGNPSDISEAIFYLLNNASYTTGHVLEVDGGRSFSL